MGRMGPTPKPTKLRLLHGDKANRVNAAEPMPPSGAPVCPDEASPEARAIWEYTIANLTAMDVATPVDRDTLMCFCEAVVIHRRASAELADAPLMVPTSRGTMMRNPLCTIQRDAAITIRHFAIEFGFSPAARSEIAKGPRTAEALPAARFLNA